MPIRRALITAVLPLLAASTAATAQAQQGAQNADTQRFQDWEVRCQSEGGQQGCTMSQVVNNPDSNDPLMSAMVGYSPEAQSAVMAFMLPLGVVLAPGMQLQVDDNEPVGFPYQFCFEQGCRADLPLEASLLQQLRSGNRATVSAIAPDGQRLDLNVSLMGFTSASQQVVP
ncbi:invasion associated locus B family protein [Vreelandella malpeensis]|uniref:Invasion associated locus B family protein n=1 Tax=Vreelandella malpeensis TaxID=1172368 RepID=A0ABS8DML4_9GAMM|nr:invasion associated locus B family protein [Halomonas malpeensis]MCB8887564.1 invasion associated locus B family protein [Halomonas malpeensis]